eukprot:CAMPEP_0115745168 /NCGR_PEP_ID=MMETSP0272-20121206/91982_1 /TAXON_ID=71861 /ORGANISM="Scrippsiella trochoidea, Strain CCMP3099" /LENGTH=265 /DNA_ID=CAMNT_0003190069 /DNA_START=66 /DNA_END=864 /DNA_ORIENTATION=-
MEDGAAREVLGQEADNAVLANLRRRDGIVVLADFVVRPAVPDDLLVVDVQVEGVLLGLDELPLLGRVELERPDRHVLFPRFVVDEEKAGLWPETLHKDCEFVCFRSWERLQVRKVVRPGGVPLAIAACKRSRLGSLALLDMQDSHRVADGQVDPAGSGEGVLELRSETRHREAPHPIVGHGVGQAIVAGGVDHQVPGGARGLTAEPSRYLPLLPPRELSEQILLLFDDHHAEGAARELEVGEGVPVRVVPEGATHVVSADCPVVL